MNKQVICIIAEGSYPYIVGGVSGWIHQLIKGNPDKNFKILSIWPSIEEDSEIKYEFPKNLIEFKTIYLADIERNPINKKKFMKYSQEETEFIDDFINMDLNDNTIKALELLSDSEKSQAFEVTISEYFWKKILEKYQGEYSRKEFNSFYWSYKSVFLFMMNILQNNIPEADLYHSVSTGYAGIIGVLAKIKYDKPCYLTEHGIYAREREEDILKSKWVEKDFKKIWIDYFYFLSKIAYKYSDQIISLFEYNRNLQLLLGAPKEKTKIISNGIDVKRLSNIEKVDTGKFIVGSLLRIVPIKDVKMMIKSFKIVAEKIENIELYLLGPYEEDLEYYKECQELINDFDLKDKVLFTGRVDIKDYLGKFDIFLISSISEGQPLALLEAMAAKIPVIATDVGDCRGVLTYHKDIGAGGIIVPPTSYVKMANAILELYNNPKKRIYFGDNGYNIVNKYYQDSKFLDAYNKLYNERWR